MYALAPSIAFLREIAEIDMPPSLYNWQQPGLQPYLEDCAISMWSEFIVCSIYLVQCSQQPDQEVLRHLSPNLLSLTIKQIR